MNSYLVDLFGFLMIISSNYNDVSSLSFPVSLSLKKNSFLIAMVSGTATLLKITRKIVYLFIFSDIKRNPS